MVRSGLGRHIFYLLQNQHTLEQLSEATKLEYINEILIMFGIMFVRVSICFLLLRIFGLGTKRWWKWALYLVMVCAVLTCILSAVVALAQCRPLSKLWNPLVHGSCWGLKTTLAFGDYNGGNSLPPFVKQNSLLMLHQAVSVFCDWALASLPIVFVRKLQMSVKLKTGICILLGMGFL